MIGVAFGVIHDWIHALVSTHDPEHIGAVVADVVEMAALVVMLVMVVQLYRKVKQLHKRIKELHPDD